MEDEGIMAKSLVLSLGAELIGPKNFQMKLHVMYFDYPANTPS